MDFLRNLCDLDDKDAGESIGRKDEELSKFEAFSVDAIGQSWAVYR